MLGISDDILYGQNLPSNTYAELAAFYAQRTSKVIDQMVQLEHRMECLLQAKQKVKTIAGIPFVLNKSITKDMLAWDEAHHVKIDPWQYEKLLNRSLLSDSSHLFHNKQHKAAFVANMMAETVWQPKININHAHLPSAVLPPKTAKQKLLYNIPQIKGFNCEPSSSSNAKPSAIYRILAKQVQ